MASRRAFANRLLAELRTLVEEVQGIRHLPLNRLSELPKDAIEQIEPVFFKDVEWYLVGGSLILPGASDPQKTTLQLTEIELVALATLRTGSTLKSVAELLCRKAAIPFEEAYPLVTSLFFRLAALRICHPRRLYNLDNGDYVHEDCHCE